MYAQDTKVALQRAKHSPHGRYVDIMVAPNSSEPAEVRIGARCPHYGDTEAMMDASLVAAQSRRSENPN